MSQVLSGKSKIAGVLGWPVSHSRSPRLHGYWLREHGIDGAYIPLPVKPEDFSAAVRALPKLGFQGANVTIPHKEAAAALVDRLDPFAQRVGAVNTIVVAIDGTLEGYNSDGFGFVENLRHQSSGQALSTGTAVVLGAGGAAAAVVAALLDAGFAKVRLVNRTRAKAEALAARLGGAIECCDWGGKKNFEGAALLVNTTSLGMQGAPPLDLDLVALPKTAWVSDIVYQPLETDLLRAVTKRGNPTVDGIGMLLHQGRLGFARWYGIDPEVTLALRDFVLG